MRISDWSSDVCSSDLAGGFHTRRSAPDYHDMTGLQRGHDQLFRQITFTARGWVDGACYWKADIDAVPASLITRDAGTHLLGMTRAGLDRKSTRLHSRH